MKLLDFDIGINHPLFIIAGPCVVESESLQIETAGFLKELCNKLGVRLIFKSSFDKANRAAVESFRGLGIEAGLKILEKVKKEIDVPILTDVHDTSEINEVSSVVDILQTPAFLCRQTDFISAIAKSNKPVNLKKGQFLAPDDMRNVVKKARKSASESGLNDDKFMVCERGVTFGYNNLISDMRSLAIMRNTNCPVIYDATHSVQLPGGLGSSSGGQREFVPVLARAAVGVGISGIFMETHPNPNVAMSDGPNAVPLVMMEDLIGQLQEIDKTVKKMKFLEEQINNF